MAGFGQLSLKQTFNVRLTLSVLLIAFSQFNFGFDQQGYASTQAMGAFAKQFGEYDPETKEYALPTAWLSKFNGFIYIGQATGVLVGSYISKRFGRRMCMFVMSIWAIICATLAITATTRDQIMVARVLNYIYIGMELAVVPVFQAEIVPPQARGFIVGTYQTSLYLGGLVINCVSLGTSHFSGSKAYRIPFGLFYVVPTTVALCIWFIPESPRWLVMKDRHANARESLRVYREGKFTDEEIDNEIGMIVAGIQRESEKGSFLDIFRSRQIRRTMVVVGANFFMQATGQQFTSIYGALFVASLNTINPFIFTVITALVNLCTSVLANTLTDILGRRPQLLAGASIQVCALMVMGGLDSIAAAATTQSLSAGIVATMVIMNFGYSLGWAPSMHIISAEIPSTRSRDMTYRTASVLNILTQFAVSYSLPYLLYAPYAALGSKVGFIFGSIAAVSIVFIRFCIPDVSGRSLEEIDKLFALGIPLRKFRGQHVEVDVDPLEDEKDPDKVAAVEVYGDMKGTDKA